MWFQFIENMRKAESTDINKMSKTERMDYIFQMERDGKFDKTHYRFGKQNEPGLNIKKLRKVCRKYEINDDAFLIYSRIRVRRR